jgi:AcrR family transcriptional regulator
MTGRVDIGGIRRAQIVDAASRVIARDGFHNASISAIEREAGVSRGVITYHFASKDDIVLAIFDAMIEQVEQKILPDRLQGLSGWERTAQIMAWALLERQEGDKFDCIHYAFLALIFHRPELRERLASLYAGMRDGYTADVAEEIGRGNLPPEDAEALGAIAASVLHGLVMQQNVSPGAIDFRRVLEVFGNMMRGYLGQFERR